MASIAPNTLYQVRYARTLTSVEKEALVTLYQPIIGADALALYFIFLGDGQTSKEHTHLDLLHLLPIGLTKLLDARKKLEGIGLLAVFEKETDAFGLVYGYELRLPLTPEHFFSDTTYSFLLESVIGERRFQELLTRYTPKTIHWDGFAEITQKFADIYRFDLTRYGQNMEKFETISTHFPSEKTELTVDQTLDFAFLAFHAHKKQISKENFTPEFNQQLALLHQLYGYDELELVEFMTQIVSLSDGMVKISELKKVIQARNAQTQKIDKSKQSQPLDEAKRIEALKQSGFSDTDILVIQESEAYPPYDYFSAIKREKKSYISKLEEWLVRELVERSRLNNSVINILLHYVLVVKNNSTLPQKLVEKLAADWSEKEVTRPEEAVQLVRKLDKESKLAKEARENAPSRYAKPTKKEVVPKWLEQQETKQTAPKKGTETTTTQQEELDARLAAYLKRKEGET